MSTDNVTVHQCTTLMTPDALTPEQLREEFTRLQGEAFAKDLEIVSLKSDRRRLELQLLNLITLRMARQTNDLLDQIDTMVGYYREHINAARTKH